MALITMGQLIRWLQLFGDVVTENKAYLTDLDSAIGDADHGINMARGMAAVGSLIDTAEADAIGPLFKKVGMTLVSSVGGASGPLYGTFFMKFGTAAATTDVLELPQLAASLRAGLDGIVARGKAELGDKTMVDAMSPALDALDAGIAAGDSVTACLSAAAAAAAAARSSRPAAARAARAAKGRSVVAFVMSAPLTEPKGCRRQSTPKDRPTTSSSSE